MLRQSSMLSALVLVSASLLCPSFAQNQPNQRRDGNWWREQPDGLRTTYVTGFFDGLDLAVCGKIVRSQQFLGWFKSLGSFRAFAV
jgi:hypothetical protein